MKKIMIMVALLCTGCFPEPVPQPTLQEQLDVSQDIVIDVIKIYKNNYMPCWSHGITSYYSCEQERQLAEPGLKFECLKNNDNVGKSDECILFRRALQPSSVNYFDYKRFLGENSQIKTDDAFLRLVEMYDDIETCGMNGEYTTTEIQSCRDEKKNKIRMFATRVVSCKELLEDKYTNKLKSEGEWYKWAINHSTDNSENKVLASYFQSVGDFWTAYYLRNTKSAPVLSPAEAKKRVSQSMEDFGKKNYCTTKDWEKEIKKLGYKL